MTLIESVLALSLIALSLPVMMLVLGQSRSTMAERVLHGQARQALLSHLDELNRGAHSEDSGRLIWVHGKGGRCLGRIGEEQYAEGLARMGGEVAGCLVVASRKPGERGNPSPLMMVLEYPATAPVARRERVEFQTLLAR